MEAEQGLLLCLPSPAATQESSVSLFLPATWILSSVLSLRPQESQHPWRAPSLFSAAVSCTAIAVPCTVLGGGGAWGDTVSRNHGLGWSPPHQDLWTVGKPFHVLEAQVTPCLQKAKVGVRSEDL